MFILFFYYPHNNNHVQNTLHGVGFMRVIQNFFSTSSSKGSLTKESPQTTRLVFFLFLPVLYSYLYWYYKRNFNYLLSHPPQDQRDEELPTLLHFAAKYGLKNLTALLLTCPGALQAYSVANKYGHYPNNIAEKQGFKDLRQFIDEYVVSSSLFLNFCPFSVWPKM